MGISQIQREKQALRKEIRARSLPFSQFERGEKDLKIQAAFFALNFVARSRRIFSYVSMGSEVATHSMIERFLASGKKVFVPFVSLAAGEMRAYQILSFDELKPGAFGVLAPSKKRNRQAEPGSFDLIVVPALAFDQQGNRLGRGAGYFDKFLKHSATAFKIGLAYENQIIDQIPVERHDVPMDGILTENNFYFTGRKTLR